MKYSIALVEYLNTLPFSEGIKRTRLDSKLDIHRVIPSRCAQLYDEGLVDISLADATATWRDRLPSLLGSGTAQG